MTVPALVEMPEISQYHVFGVIDQLHQIEHLVLKLELKPWEVREPLQAIIDLAGEDPAESSFIGRSLKEHYGLSPREFQILEMLPQGLLNKQIALEISIAEQTVKFHLTSLYKKLGVTNRTEAAIIYQEWTRQRISSS